jgi:ribosomal protein S18 acetylase RimI-like enzyme
MVVVREATPEDWEAIRDTRLSALREAPYAFASNAAREAGYSEQKWRAWTQVSGRGVMFLADLARLPEAAGIAGVLVEDGAADLISLWVRPAARGQKVGQALIEATADWSRSRGFDVLCLWVTESNAPACRLYERSGFAPTGERQPLPSDPALPMIKLRREL